MNEKIGNIIASKREEKGLSQRKLAKYSGISNTVLSHIEKGIYNPSPRVLRALSKNLDINYNDLMVMQNLNNEDIDREIFVKKFYADMNIKDLQKAFNFVKGSLFNNNEIIKELNNGLDLLSETEKEKEINTIKEYEFVNKKYNLIIKEIEECIFYEKFNLERKAVLENE